MRHQILAWVSSTSCVSRPGLGINMKVKTMPMKCSFRWIGLSGFAAVALTGCLADGSEPARPTIEDVVVSRSTDADVPDGAIQMSKGVYAVPVAIDDEGCEQFSQWAESGVTQSVVLYRDGAGGFSALKSDQVSCNAEMVSAGADDRGCPVFRAEQPDGNVTDVIYYRSESGYTVNTERAICEG